MTRKAHTGTIPALERLEDRMMLDGTVRLVVAGDTLRIYGDQYNNDIVVRGTNQAGVFAVTSGASQTSVVGDSSRAVKKIAMQLGNGNDNVLVENVTLAGSLTIDAGTGLDAENFTNDVLQGALNIRNRGGGTITAKSSTIQGDFIVHNGSSTSLDTVTLDATTVGGQLRILNGNADTMIDLINGSSVIGQIIVRNGNGTHTLSLGDGLNLTSLDVVNGNGDSTTTIGQDTFTGGLRVINGTGYDDLTFVAGSTFGKNVYVKNGNGGSITRLGVGAEFDGDLAIYAGNGVDDIEGAGGHVLGSALFNLGSGGNVLNSDQLLVDKNLTFLSGAGADQVTLTQARVNGNETISTGNGADTVQADDAWVDGKTTINTGAGNDTISLDTQDVYGVESHYTSALVVNGGAGNDVMYVGANTPNNGNVFVSMATFNGGAGTDRIEVGNQNTVEYGLKTVAEQVVQPQLVPMPLAVLGAAVPAPAPTPAN